MLAFRVHEARVGLHQGSEAPGIGWDWALVAMFLWVSVDMHYGTDCSVVIVFLVFVGAERSFGSLLVKWSILGSLDSL